MKKFIALFLVFSLLSLSGNLFAKERRGADLVITKKDGQRVRGELIAVKENSLLLKDRGSGGDVTIDIKDIRVIKIVKKSEFLLGAGTGLLVCGGLGAAIHQIEPELAAIIFGTIGFFIGGLIGVGAGLDKTIQIEGRYDLGVKMVLEKLRKKARIPDYQ